MSDSYKKIGIDCRFWGITHAGLGRYTRELVLEIIKKCSKQYQFTLFFQQDEWRKDKAALSKCQIIETNAPHYSIYKEQFELKKIIEREKLDLMHFTHFNVPIFLQTPYIVTIHDLIKHFFKGRPVTTHSLPVYWLKYGGYRLVIGQAIKGSRAIIVPSYFTKDQIAVHYPGFEKKIKVIYEGVKTPFTDNRIIDQHKTKKIKNKYNITKPYFIYTGSAYASKNVKMLILAVKQLIENGNEIQLIIACARNYFWEKLEKEIIQLNMQDYVVMPGMIPDDELSLLYQNSLSFVMPSLMEGFGLPALEAMASGAIILSSNTGSLPEIYENNAIYFNPTKLSKMISGMEFVIKMSDLQRITRIKRGIKFASKYSWDKAALETLDLYSHFLD